MPLFSVIDKITKMTLARVTSNGEGGSRGLWKGTLWKGTYEPQRSINASPAKEEEASQSTRFVRNQKEEMQPRIAKSSS